MKCQLCRKDWRVFLLVKSVLFKTIPLQASSALGMLPMFWLGCCGDHSCWASVFSPGQQSRQIWLSFLSLSNLFRFPQVHIVAISWLCNTQRRRGRLQLRCVITGCAELSCYRPMGIVAIIHSVIMLRNLVNSTRALWHRLISHW